MTQKNQDYTFQFEVQRPGHQIVPLQIEITAELRQQLRLIAASRQISLKQLVLRALGETYPELKALTAQNITERTLGHLDH